MSRCSDDVGDECYPPCEECYPRGRGRLKRLGDRLGAAWLWLCDLAFDVFEWLLDSFSDPWRR